MSKRHNYHYGGKRDPPPKRCNGRPYQQGGGGGRGPNDGNFRGGGGGYGGGGYGGGGYNGGRNNRKYNDNPYNRGYDNNRGGGDGHGEGYYDRDNSWHSNNERNPDNSCNQGNNNNQGDQLPERVPSLATAQQPPQQPAILSDPVARAAAENAEFQARSNLQDELLALTTLKERREQFRALSKEEQLGLFLPGMESVPNQMSLSFVATQNPPEELAARMEQTVEELVEKMLTAKVDKARNEEGTPTNPHYDPYEDLVESDDDQYFMGNSVKETYEVKETEDQDEKFCRGLLYFPPLWLGFTVSAQERQNSEFCWCPCSVSTFARKWRAFCGIIPGDHENDDNQDKFNCPKGKKGRYNPQTLLAHVMSVGQKCPRHELLYRFLKGSFADYHYPGTRHVAFSNVNEKSLYVTFGVKLMNDQEVTRAKKKDEDDIKEAQKKTENELEEAKRQLQTLKETNAEMASRLDDLNEFKRKFEALDSVETEWKREIAQNARDLFDHFRTQTFDDLSINLLKLNRSSKPRHVPFVVTEDFDLNDQMEIWYSAYSKAKGDSKKLPTNFGCLFHDNDIPKVGAEPEKELLVAKLRHQVVQRWRILLSLNVENEEIKEVEEAIQQADMKIKQEEVEVVELTVKDEGGPTRHFFDRVWYQLEGLKVTAPAKMKSEESKSLELFERCKQSGLLLPVTDEKIQGFLPTVKDPTATREKIECFFRAIGRMLAQCMLRTPLPKEETSDDGPIAVPTHVLPNIFKTVLLRELDVTNEAYPLGALIDHCAEILNLNVNSREDKSTHAPKEDLLTKYIGEADDETKTKIDEAETSQERGRILREAINENFISVARFTAIANLSNGVSLGGVVRWCYAFKLVPTKTVEKIVFGINDISHDMVFDESGDFRFIVFDDDMIDREKSMKHSDVQAEFKAMLKDVFREKLDEDALKRQQEHPGEATKERSFISKFIYFCTASWCLPNLELHPEWKIHVEFNCTEMDPEFLPIVHTCTHCIKIPGTAYGADKKKFLEKLEASMGQTLESFDMA